MPHGVDFYARWISEHPDKKIWNENLQDYILVKYQSILGKIFYSFAYMPVVSFQFVVKSYEDILWLDSAHNAFEQAGFAASVVSIR